MEEKVSTQYKKGTKVDSYKYSSYSLSWYSKDLEQFTGQLLEHIVEASTMQLSKESLYLSA